MVIWVFIALIGASRTYFVPETCVLKEVVCSRSYLAGHTETSSWQRSASEFDSLCKWKWRTHFETHTVFNLKPFPPSWTFNLIRAQCDRVYRVCNERSTVDELTR